MFNYSVDLRARLNLYGLEIGLLNSCLLDVIEPTKEHLDYVGDGGQLMMLHLVAF